MMLLMTGLEDISKSILLKAGNRAESQFSDYVDTSFQNFEYPDISKDMDRSKESNYHPLTAADVIAHNSA